MVSYRVSNLSPEGERVTSRETWKKMERKVATGINGKRVVCSGVRGEGDVEHSKYFIECKYRQKFVCRDWFLKAKVEAKKESKIPILVIKQKSTKGELAVVDWEWLCGVLEKIKEGDIDES